MKRLLLTLALLVWTLPAFAQTTWPRDVTFHVVADHLGDNDLYRLYQNDVVVQTLLVSALINGSITFDFPGGLPPGSYAFVVEAVYPDVALKSDPLTLTVTEPAPPPILPTSPDQTTVPPAAQIVDTAGDVWTIGSPNVILKNGASYLGGFGSVLTWCGGTVRTLGVDGQWWEVSATGWIPIGSLNPCAAPPPPPPVDCVVSAWSCQAWSVCSVSGSQTRSCTRSIVTPAANGGLACPTDLTRVETQACSPPPPPPVDVCVSDPLKPSVTRWPASPSKSSSGTWTPNGKTLVSAAFVWGPLRFVATDTRGCTATVTK